MQVILPASNYLPGTSPLVLPLPNPLKYFSLSFVSISLSSSLDAWGRMPWFSFMIWSKRLENVNNYPFTKVFSALNTNPGRLAGYFGFLLCHCFSLEERNCYLLTWVKGEKDNSNPSRKFPLVSVNIMLISQRLPSS